MIDAALEKLRSFGQLKPGWDRFSAKRISASSIRASEDVLKSSQDRYGDSLIVPSVDPVRSSGVCLKWDASRVGDAFLELEFSDGQVLWVRGLMSHGIDETSNGVADRNGAVRLIKWLHGRRGIDGAETIDHVSVCSAVKGIADDLLDPELPPDRVVEQLRQLGLDPDAIAASGRQFASRLEEKSRRPATRCRKKSRHNRPIRKNCKSSGSESTGCAPVKLASMMGAMAESVATIPDDEVLEDARAAGGSSAAATAGARRVRGVLSEAVLKAKSLADLPVKPQTAEKGKSLDDLSKAAKMAGKVVFLGEDGEVGVQPFPLESEERLKAEKPKSDSLGWRVWFRRREIGMTQRQLSEQATISIGFVKNIEGNGRNPSGSIIVRLAAALRTTTDWLLTGVGLKRSSTSCEPQKRSKPDQAHRRAPWEVQNSNKRD